MAAPLFHVVFLSLLALCVAGALLWRGRAAGWGGWGLGATFGLAFAALLLHQACWQLSGFGSLGFQKFQRRYDARPATLARASEGRGRLLDRHGAVLAEAEPGRQWGQRAPLGEPEPRLAFFRHNLRDAFSRAPFYFGVAVDYAVAYLTGENF